MLLGAVATIVTLLSIGTGAVHVARGEVIAVLLSSVGVDAFEADRTSAVVVTAIRLPRAVLCALVSAGLAIAGAAKQGMFRNPLADQR